MFRALVLSLAMVFGFSGSAIAAENMDRSGHGPMIEYGISTPSTNVLYNARGDKMIEELGPVRVWLHCPEGECKQLYLLSDGEVRAVRMKLPVASVFAANGNAIGLVQRNGERFVVQLGRPDNNGECVGYITPFENYKDPLFGVKYIHEMN